MDLLVPDRRSKDFMPGNGDFSLIATCDVNKTPKPWRRDPGQPAAQEFGGVEANHKGGQGNAASGSIPATSVETSVSRFINYGKYMK